ncbi:MAG TPA: hypothetical protein VF657_19350 [Actinoplanes sp.]
MVNFSVAVIGVTAGVAQLAGLSKGPGRIVLGGVLGVCLLFLIVRWWYLHYDAKIDELAEERETLLAELAEANRMLAEQSAQLATLQVGHQRYIDAIDGIVDQGGPLFHERLEMTVTVGADDDADTVVERHHTVPESRLPQRSFRPITPADRGRLLSMEEIGLRAEILTGSGQITPLPLVKNGLLRIWLVFDPGLTRPADWEVEYQPKGLWAPLRRRGYDSLAWTDRLPIGNGGASVLDEFVVKFVFPRSRQPPSVSERHHFGEVLSPRLIDGTDRWLIEFRDLEPAGRRYEWDLTQPVRAAQRPVGQQAARS